MKKIMISLLLTGVFLFSGCTDNNSFECSLDSDCVPARCCHPTSCIPVGQLPDCEGFMCTYECQPNSMDCGQGSCVCVDGKCQVKWLEK